jgi:hypothetical protein
MTLTVRSATVTGATTKGSALTHAELDENFNHLSQSSNHTFTQSGSGAATNLTVQEKFRQTKAVLDFVTDSSVRAGIVAGTDTSDHSTYLQAALDADFNLDFQGYTFYGNNLTDDKDDRSFVSTNGVAKIIKNANGALFTSSGDRVFGYCINGLGDASSPTFTGDGLVFTGAGVTLINCGAKWHPGRALKSTGAGRTVIKGTCDVYATSGATGSDYDIEIGVSGTATLYHHIEDVYSSQTTGGILLVDTGSHTIIGGEFGKLTIAAGTSPSGVNGGKTVGARILGAVTVELSGAVFSANQFGASASITFAAGTSGCSLDASNTHAGAAITNNGNTNNLIIREVSSGSENHLKFGDDTTACILKIQPTTNVATHTLKVARFRAGNATGYRVQTAADGDGGYWMATSSDNMEIGNLTANKTFDVFAAGATGVVCLMQNSTRRLTVDANGVRAGTTSGPYITPSVGANVGDAAATLTVGTSAMTQRWETELTQDRAVTLSTTGAANGSKFRIVRTAAGAFNLNVGTGPLAALVEDEWCDVEYNGSAWMLVAKGSLA